MFKLCSCIPMCWMVLARVAMSVFTTQPRISVVHSGGLQDSGGNQRSDPRSAPAVDPVDRIRLNARCMGSRTALSSCIVSSNSRMASSVAELGQSSLKRNNPNEYERRRRLVSQTQIGTVVTADPYVKPGGIAAMMHVLRSSSVRSVSPVSAGYTLSEADLISKYRCRGVMFTKTRGVHGVQRVVMKETGGTSMKFSMSDFQFVCHTHSTE